MVFGLIKGTSTAITTYETIANALADKNQVYMVLRDVARAFDKVWHNGLKYKILRLGLPDIIKKILCHLNTDVYTQCMRTITSPNKSKLMMKIKVEKERLKE